jgi:hypothetical protein
LEARFKENWFPKCWLVFVFHGLPAPPVERAVELLSGITTETPKRHYEEVSGNSSAAILFHTNSLGQLFVLILI